MNKQEADQLTIQEKKEFVGFHDLMESIMRGRPTQQYRAYLWEQELLDMKGLDKGSMPQTDAQGLVNKILGGFGMASPKVQIQYVIYLPKGTSGRTVYDPRTKKQFIEIAPHSASTYTVLHESAHMLMNCIGLFEGESHGPDYVRIFCELMSRFGGLDLQKCIQSAKDNDIAVSGEMPKGLVYQESRHRKAA